MSMFHGPRKKAHPANKLTKWRRSAALERLEDRMAPAVSRSIDGTGNNLTNILWGSAGTDLVRIAPAAYANGLSAPSGATRPNARTISNAIVDQGDGDMISDRELSAMVYAWGQFLDHDLDLTGGASPATAFNVAVPAGDPYFDPNNTGTQIIQLNRSLYNTSTGTTNARQQINTVTAWIDGSQIYGSDTATADKLRTHVGGRLKTSPGADGVLGTDDDLLPYNNATYFPNGTVKMANDAHIVPDSQMFAAGDVRANENVELTTLHTIFVREHNRVADTIRRSNPGMSDENIYQRARAWVIAELQVITYREWLPAVLGRNAIRDYTGYKASVNPGIANEFSTALFRVGHTMLGDDVEFLDNNGNEIAEEIPLSAAFFNPDVINENGVDPILKYLASDPASEIDSTIVNSVRNFLFGPPGAGGFDLASLNIQRGRDHGLADYNTMRAAYGLPKVTSFSQISSDPDIRTKLQKLYGSVNHIDAWVGALAEDHVPGTSTGPLIRRGLADQFERIRDGDRFWYERMFSGSDLAALNRTTLQDVIRRNTDLTNLQSGVFFFQATISGTVFLDANRDHRLGFHEHGVGGQTVQLVNLEDNEIIATTTTRSDGSFRFDVGDGVRTGRYAVREVLPNGFVLTTPLDPVVRVTRGDIDARVNIGIAPQISIPLPTAARSSSTDPATNTGTTDTAADEVLIFDSAGQLI